ncbi:hypothetical protein Btru_028542 [Bulinus truncatus]|nr:hypothetical protein Btru_028542 [Bulinus truncatus]
MQSHDIAARAVFRMGWMRSGVRVQGRDILKYFKALGEIINRPSVPEDPTLDNGELVETVLSSPGSPFDISMVENANSRSKRAVKINTTPWPYKIPYVIDDTYKQLGPHNTMILKRAMKYIMDRVCIEFVDVTDTYKRNESKWLINNGFEIDSYIKFSNTGGCNADIGPSLSGPRVNNPCRGFWINLHELGHSVGAEHTHQSPYRDNYITVHTENIKPQKFCNDPSVDCSRGYMARVKGVCRCVCPEERDEGNNCKTLRNGPLAYAQWPNTPMVLLAGGPQHTCPEGFTKGWFSFTGKYAISQSPKPPVLFPSSGTTNYIPVCTKDTPTGSDID